MQAGKITQKWSARWQGVEVEVRARRAAEERALGLSYRRQRWRKDERRRQSRYGNSGAFCVMVAEFMTQVAGELARSAGEGGGTVRLTEASMGVTVTAKTVGRAARGTTGCDRSESDQGSTRGAQMAVTCVSVRGWTARMRTRLGSTRCSADCLSGREYRAAWQQGAAAGAAARTG